MKLTYLFLKLSFLLVSPLALNLQDTLVESPERSFSIEDRMNCEITLQNVSKFAELEIYVDGTKHRNRLGHRLLVGESSKVCLSEGRHRLYVYSEMYGWEEPKVIWVSKESISLYLRSEAS